MLIQKLRLQHGWSQQQLATMSGLSTRTIQRIENGKKPSLESVKSLAAVFEVDFSTLHEALSMNRDTPVTQSEGLQSTQLTITEEEKRAYKHVRELKCFYGDLIVFAVVIVFLTILNALTSPSYWWVAWVFFGWGLSFAIRAVSLFGNIPLFNAEWEKKQLDKYKNR